MLGYEPSDAELMEHLNLQSRPTISEYDWVDAKVMCISSALSTEATLSIDDIVFGDLS